MSDGLLPLNPGAGGKIEDVEDLIGAGATPVVRQRIQVVGAILAEVARVIATPPVGTEYALVTRNLPSGVQDVASAQALTSAITRVVAATGNTPLLAPNAARRGAAIYNDSPDAFLFLKLNAAASTTSFTARLSPGGYYELPSPIWTGEIDAVWSSASGAALITELT